MDFFRSGVVSLSDINCPLKKQHAFLSAMAAFKLSWGQTLVVSKNGIDSTAQPGICSLLD